MFRDFWFINTLCLLSFYPFMLFHPLCFNRKQHVLNMDILYSIKRPDVGFTYSSFILHFSPLLQKEMFFLFLSSYLMYNYCWKRNTIFILMYIRLFWKVNCSVAGLSGLVLGYFGIFNQEKEKTWRCPSSDVWPGPDVT